MAVTPRGLASFRRVIERRYATWGTEIEFMSPIDSSAKTMTIVDQTRGVEIKHSGTEISTVSPAVEARVSDLSTMELEPVDMIGVRFWLHGIEWRVERTSPKPGPFGANDGEVYLLLSEVP